MADSGTYDQATLLRRAKIAEAMLAGPNKPITHWAEGLNELAKGAIGGYQLNHIDELAKQQREQGNAELYAALGLPAPASKPVEPSGFAKIGSLLGFGGGAPSSPAQQIPAPSPAPDAVPPSSSPNYGDAIAGIESGGKYDALGPETGGDRAYGKYQVMGKNIPEWTQAALGKPMTAEEFLANPEAQEAVFKQRFGQYVDKYGPEGAAKAWFAGEKGMNNPNAKDVLGTTVGDYGKKFLTALGPQPSTLPAVQAIDNAMQTPPPQQVAQAGPVQPSTNSVAAALGNPAASQPQQTGILAGVPADKKAQIAKMLTSTNPTMKAFGAQMLGNYTKADAPTDEMKEYNLAVKQAQARGEKVPTFFEYKTGIKKAGAQNISIDQKPELAFDTKAGQLQAERFNDLATDGQNARQMISDINTLTDLGKQIGTGKEAQVKAALGPYAEALGVKIDKLPEIQAFEAIVNRVAPNLRVKGSGAQSDFELKNFLKSLPSIGNTPEGNEMAGVVLKGLQENKIRAAEIGSRALNKEISRSEAEKQLRELPDPMEPYRAYRKAHPEQPKAPSPAAAPQAPAAGAIMDGFRFKGGDPSKRENWEPVT